jgi:predicted GNAT family acetyltransferase
MKNRKIIKVEPQDWSKLRTIRLIALKTHPEAFGAVYDHELNETDQYWINKLNDPNQTYYAIEINNVFVSIAGVKRVTKDSRMIVSVYTLEAYRKNGYSKKIIQRIIYDTRKQSICKKVFMYVNSSLNYVVSFYEKLDFMNVKSENYKQCKMGNGIVCDLLYYEMNI